jgi:hypothetical protein
LPEIGGKVQFAEGPITSNILTFTSENRTKCT